MQTPLPPLAVWIRVAGRRFFQYHRPLTHHESYGLERLSEHTRKSETKLEKHDALVIQYTEPDQQYWS